jgi:hypothetical protein
MGNHHLWLNVECDFNYATNRFLVTNVHFNLLNSCKLQSHIGTFDGGFFMMEITYPQGWYMLGNALIGIFCRQEAFLPLTDIWPKLSPLKVSSFEQPLKLQVFENIDQDVVGD